MSLFDRLTDRLLAALGLDFDVSLDLVDEPFHAITPSLMLGSRPRSDQVERLQEMGVTHVVSVLPEDERLPMGFLEDHFETLFLPIRDGVHEDIAACFPPFFDFVEAAGDGSRVLVHCEVGVSRSASLVVAQVMKDRNLRFFEAYGEVRIRRPQVLPNVGFASQLQRFEHELFPEPREGFASLTRYLQEVCNVPVEIEVLQNMLELHGYDGIRAIQAIFGGDVPRVVQGVRV